MQNLELVPGDVLLGTGTWINNTYKVGSPEHFEQWKIKMEEVDITTSQFAYGVWYSLCPICCGDCRLMEEKDHHIITTICKYCKGMGTFKAYYAEQPQDTVRKLQMEFIAAIAYNFRTTPYMEELKATITEREQRIQELEQCITQKEQALADLEGNYYELQEMNALTPLYDE